MLRVERLLEDLVTAKVQGDLVQKRGLPAPLPLKACGNVPRCHSPILSRGLPAPLLLKACGNVPQCHSPFLSRASISIKENFTSILDHCCRTLSNLLVSVLSPQLAS